MAKIGQNQGKFESAPALPDSPHLEAIPPERVGRGWPSVFNESARSDVSLGADRTHTDA